MLNIGDQSDSRMDTFPLARLEGLGEESKEQIVPESSLLPAAESGRDDS